MFRKITAIVVICVVCGTMPTVSEAAESASGGACIGAALRPEVPGAVQQTFAAQVPGDDIQVLRQTTAEIADEFPFLRACFYGRGYAAALKTFRRWLRSQGPEVARFAKARQREVFVAQFASAEALYASATMREIAALRLWKYLDLTGRVIRDFNEQNRTFENHPFKPLWACLNRRQSPRMTVAYLEDMRQLFRAFMTGTAPVARCSSDDVQQWMARYPSGLEPAVIARRERNKERIVGRIIAAFDRGEVNSTRYVLEPWMSDAEKRSCVYAWWETFDFHLRFAIRSADALQEMLAGSLSDGTMALLHEAERKKIPFFVNPYYLSLLDVEDEAVRSRADQVVREYVVYNPALVAHFGSIMSWEREDQVVPGEPNAAGWILPARHLMQRRYPEVAIFMPETRGRSCGGLCSVCQRFFNFQNGVLGFDLEALKPQGAWREHHQMVMQYFEEDTQLRDILITGGDALMSRDETLRIILAEVLTMIGKKVAANRKRPDGAKYSEISRVRLGTRLPVYLPQRVTPELIVILDGFQREARRLGVQQCIIQTHIESPYEVTPEMREAVARLQSAGWIVTNQHVFTAAASRRGHTARLRRLLNDLGVLPYYTFSVKGGYENSQVFATNARLVQEMVEEKPYGKLRPRFDRVLTGIHGTAVSAQGSVARIRTLAGKSFVATDRSCMNLPGIGKSLSFRVVGITPDGRRVLAFSHDALRRHSPVVDRMPTVYVVESRSILSYLEQLATQGEDPALYASLWQYSLGITERRSPVFEYPAYAFSITKRLTHFARKVRKFFVLPGSEPAQVEFLRAA